MPEGSSIYSSAFLIWTILTIAWSTWVGWKRGVVRSIVSLAGMLAGFFAGMAAAGVVAPLLGWLIPVPAVVIGVVVGLVVGIGVWAVIAIFGAILFKTTEHQGSFLLRLFYGGGGAVIGVLLGLTWVWGALFLVRGLGAFSEPRFGDVAKYYGVPEPGFLEEMAVRINQSIEVGSVGHVLEAMDPMPESTYRMMGKVGRLASDPSALQRLLDQPQIRELTGDETFVELAADDGVNAAARSGEVKNLLTNEKLLRAASDPGLIEKMRAIDFEAALDGALEDQPPMNGDLE